MPSYQTVDKFAFDEFVEKRSRFIGYAKPVKTPDEANAFIEEIKAKHWDAKHNVYAYILRDGNRERYSDDGEPQGTAGVPTLDVLKKSGVTDVVVVVTRYFGGILLGGGGLVRAYSHAASIALAAAGIVTMRSYNLCHINMDYNLYGKFENLVKECGGNVLDSNFSDNVEINFQIPDEEMASFDVKLKDLSLGKASFDIVEEHHYGRE